MELKGNTILITGGTSGFGFEFAKRLLALGNTIIITGRNASKLEETKRILPDVHTIQSDVSKAEDITRLHQRILQDFPDLNILINNAGEMRLIVLNDEFELADITREVEINLMGPIRMIQQFLPLIKQNRNPAILNVTSGIALTPFPISPIYGASKSGLRSYTQSLRIQLKHTGIRVFELVAPGSKTPLNDKFKKLDGFTENGFLAPDKIVNAAICGMKGDQFEIYPGPLWILRFIIRLFPGFVLSMASKVGAQSMAARKN